MTVDHWAIHLGGWGRYKPPAVPLWSEAPKNLHLTAPNSGSNTAQQYVDGFAFFHVHCSTKSQENPKGPTFLILKFLIRKKCVCSVVDISQI